MNKLNNLMNIESPVIVKVADLKQHPKNPRKQNPKAMEFLRKSIDNLGSFRPLLVNHKNEVLAGNQLLSVLQEKGIDEIVCIYPKRELSAIEEKHIIVADNQNSFHKSSNQWDVDIFANEFDFVLEDYDLDFNDIDFTLDVNLENINDITNITTSDELNRTTASDYNKSEQGALKKKFLWTPFSVFDTKQGDWQDKKRYWKSKGIDSGAGRGENLLALSTSIMLDTSGTSIFDPVLCEILYNWYCPKDGLILDCFAGGSVRGVMANFQGMNYIGCDLRQEQVDANRNQYDLINNNENFKNSCTWICDDSRNILNHCKDVKADLLFSCPPYADLEVYSDDPLDISNMDYTSFLEAYRDIINKSCSLLKDNSFAIFVVGEVRDKKGNYYNFVGDTVQAFRDAGLQYYNEAILLNTMGTTPLRVNGMFTGSRKLGKVHQNVLIFCKGDPKKATTCIGDIDFKDIKDITNSDIDINGIEEL